jgi:hypothetical protein
MDPLSPPAKVAVARAAHVPTPASDALSELTAINLDDLTLSFGWQHRPRLGAILRWQFRGLARKFARQMLEFDRLVGSDGFPCAGRETLRLYARSLRVFGRENVPTRGPVIVLSNHPGLADTLCLFAAIDRIDLRIIAIDRPFLRALPNTSARLFYVGEDAAHRMSAVKRTSAHLRSGGAVMTFPAGEIEPDPDAYQGAIESLARWTDSAGVFLRFAPQAAIVPAVVRGVVWKRLATNPLVTLKRPRAERERLAAALQLMSHLLLHTKPVDVTVEFGQPLELGEGSARSMESIHAELLDRTRALLRIPQKGQGEQVL